MEWTDSARRRAGVAGRITGLGAARGDAQWRARYTVCEKNLSVAEAWKGAVLGENIPPNFFTSCGYRQRLRDRRRRISRAAIPRQWSQSSAGATARPNEVGTLLPQVASRSRATTGPCSDTTARALRSVLRDQPPGEGRRLIRSPRALFTASAARVRAHMTSPSQSADRMAAPSRSTARSIVAASRVSRASRSRRATNKRPSTEIPNGGQSGE